MIRRLWTVYTVEIEKALRTKQTYVGPFLVLLSVLAALLLYPITRDDVSDYEFIAHATPPALNNLGFFLLLIYSANLISVELGDGSVRQTLVRPVLRRDYLLAKLGIGMTYALVLTFVVASTSWALVYLLGDAVGISNGAEQVYTHMDMISAYGAGLLLGMLPQWAGVAFAILISTCTRRPLAAITLVLGLWILLNVVKYPLGIDAFVFSSYLERPWEVFNYRCDNIETSWMPMLSYCVATSVGTFAVCVGGALFIFARRNVTTAT